MFGFKKKSAELRTECYYTIYWKTEEKQVYFKDYIDLIEENGLKIIDLWIRNVKNFEGEDFLFMTFGVEGTFSQLNLFEDLCLVDGRMEYFRKLGEGF